MEILKTSDLCTMAAGVFFHFAKAEMGGKVCPRIMHWPLRVDETLKGREGRESDSCTSAIHMQTARLRV